MVLTKLSKKPKIRKKQLLKLIYCTNLKISDMAKNLDISSQWMRKILINNDLKDEFKKRKKVKKIHIEKLSENLLSYAFEAASEISPLYCAIITDIYDELQKISNVKRTRFDFEKAFEFWGTYRILEIEGRLTVPNMKKSLDWIKYPHEINNRIKCTKKSSINSRNAMQVRPRDKMIMLEKAIVESTLPNYDIAYFYHESRETVAQKRKRMSLSNCIIRLLDSNIYGSSFGNASIIYEAKFDAEMNIDEIDQLLFHRLKKKNIEVILERREAYEPLIIDQLKILFPKHEINVPWVTKSMKQWYNTNYRYA